MTIINAKIYTCDKQGIIENGFIEIKNGKIFSIGDMQVFKTSNEQVFDANGKTLTPGFVEGHCHIGMWEDSLGFEGDDGNEDTDPATPHLRAIDAINPFDLCFAEALQAGVTTVVTGPGSSNPIGGQFAALKTYGKTVEDKLIKAPICIKAALGENPKISYHIKNLSPVTRMAIAGIIREQLFKASRYIKDVDKALIEEDFDEPEFDIKNEAYIPLFKGDIPLHIHAHRADDILTAIRICEEFNLDLSVVHCTDGELVADILKEKNISVLLGPSLSDRSKPELKNLSFKTAGILDNKGIKTAIITDHPNTPIQYLPLCAALSIKNGMDYLSALKAITINPAEICGISNRVGSIEIGKDADLVIFNGEPFDIFSTVEAVFINGEKVK